VDALRGIMIQGGQSLHPFYVDLGVMAVIFVILATIASKLYPTLVR
jgi:ABC-2 type transport system permease protein